MKYILVVDDDDSYVYLIERRLRSISADLTVKTCSTGQEALDYLQSLRPGMKIPDLLMLDLNMPVMGGFDFLEAYERVCRARHSSVSPPDIWIVTSSDVESDKEKAHHFTSAKGYLVKPIGKKEIQHLLETGS